MCEFYLFIIPNFYSEKFRLGILYQCQLKAYFYADANLSRTACGNWSGRILISKAFIRNILSLVDLPIVRSFLFFRVLPFDFSFSRLTSWAVHNYNPGLYIIFRPRLGSLMIMCLIGSNQNESYFWKAILCIRKQAIR